MNGELRRQGVLLAVLSAAASAVLVTATPAELAPAKPAEVAPAKAVEVALAKPAEAVPPTSPDCRPPQNHRKLPETPWHVRRYSPARIWPVSNGAGVTVAVIDSGVDAGHPQLRGAVDPGRDLLDGQPTAAFDCLGHGTGVASIIAARPVDGVGFTGLAPGARILPIRVSERVLDSDGQPQGDTVTLGSLATAIDAAVDGGARVINMSIYYFADDARVKAAIQRARKRDVVIVAAAGNAHVRDGATPDPVPYPAAYDGVIGVGAIDENGARVSDSQVGPYVDLVAPGGGVTVAANRTGDHVIVDGTSFAAPHVAAAAALVRSRFPGLTAPQVEERLRVTAGPTRGGPRSDAYGYGEVDPFRAVNSVWGADGVTMVDPPPMYDARAAAVRAAREAAARRRFGGLAAAGLLLATAVAFAAWAVPRGRRRGWRPGETQPERQVATGRDDDGGGTFEWSLGAAPILPHPDRAETERYVNMLPGRAGARGRG